MDATKKESWRENCSIFLKATFVLYTLHISNFVYFNVHSVFMRKLIPTLSISNDFPTKLLQKVFEFPILFQSRSKSLYPLNVYKKVIMACHIELIKPFIYSHFCVFASVFLF